jgi:hypothetical protein
LVEIYSSFMFVCLPSGPDDEGCPEGSGSVCEESVFGCCPDGVTPANRPNQGGCDVETRPLPETLTTETPQLITKQPDPGTTAIEIVPDSVTTSRSKDATEPTQEKEYPCLNSAFGCCPDMITEAVGPDNQGCDVIPKSSPTEVVDSSGEDIVGNEASNGFMTEPVEVVTTVPVIRVDTGSGSDEEENILGSVSPDTTSPDTTLPDTKTPTPVIKPPTTALPTIELTTEVPLTNLTELQCNASQYGCCPDSATVALGPNGEGCQNLTLTISSINCNLTKFGCCSDGVTPAGGREMEGCPLTTEGLTTSLPQAMTEKYAPLVNMSELIPEIEVLEMETAMSCNTSFYGCCPDMQTPAMGFDDEGCSDDEKTTTDEMPDYGYWTVEANIDIDKFPCHKSRFGCCPNRRIPAKGPEQEGCATTSTMTTVAMTSTSLAPAESPCVRSDFGCCDDGVSFAFGSNMEGCDKKSRGNCQKSKFGCCSDGTAAEGENGKGCIDSMVVLEVPDCIYSDFGCCLDGKTPATGPHYQGCGHEVDCSSTKFGCCPKSKLAATGPGYEGCPSDVMPGSKFFHLSF